MTDPNVMAVIPARFGSSRLPGKPLSDISGKPMVQYVYDQARQAHLIDDVIVATDDKRIRDVVTSFDGKVAMTSDHHRSGTDRVAEVAERIHAKIIVIVQGDEPLIPPESIDAVVEPLLIDSDLGVTNLVAEIEEPARLSDSDVVKAVMNQKGFIMYLSRAEIPFAETDVQYRAFQSVGVYALRRTHLLQYTAMKPTPLERQENIEMLRFLENGHAVKAVVTPFSGYSIDTASDLIRVRERFGEVDNPGSEV